MTDRTSETDNVLERLGAATLGESGGLPMRARIRAAWPGARVVGPAFPVRCSHGDNLAIHVGVATAPPGSILVAQIDGDPERGYWGEVLTTAAEARGVVGLVIDGGVRDVDALVAHGFGAFATMVALRGATKQEAGSVGGIAEVGDVSVRDGDWVVGDVDGVTVIPRDQLEEVIAAGLQREQRARDLFLRLREGATTVELLGLDPSPVWLAGRD